MENEKLIYLSCFIGVTSQALEIIGSIRKFLLVDKR